MILKVLFLFSAVISIASAGSLIDKWGRCKISDPNLNDCLTKACINMVHDLKDGNAEHGIPPWDPFKTDRMVLKSGGKGPVNMEMIMDNMTMTHLTDFSDLKVDASKLKDMVFRMVLKIPSMHVSSKYKMSGNMLAVPVKGDGDVQLDMTNCDVDLTMKGSPLKKGGKTYWKIDKTITKFEPGNMKMSFTGLFGGDKKLGSATNKVLNDNWKLMHNEFTPYIDSEFARTALPIANSITQLEPFDEMFPK